MHRRRNVAGMEAGSCRADGKVRPWPRDLPEGNQHLLQTAVLVGGVYVVIHPETICHSTGGP